MAYEVVDDRLASIASDRDVEHEATSLDIIGCGEVACDVVECTLQARELRSCAVRRMHLLIEDPVRGRHAVVPSESVVRSVACPRGPDASVDMETQTLAVGSTDLAIK